MKERLNLTGCLILWLQVKLPTEPQPQLQTDPQTELYTDDTQKNNNTKKSDADCSDVADSTASADVQKNNGWYINHNKSGFVLIYDLKRSTISCTFAALFQTLFANNFEFTIVISFAFLSG